MAPPGQPDRYQPLPGLLELPGYLLRKLSARGRRIAAVAGVLLAIGAAAGVAVGVPAIVDAKRQQAAADARAAARERAARLAALRAEQRPVQGRGAAARGLTGDAALAARHALAADLALAVEADARSRAATGKLDAAPRRAECWGYPVRPGGFDPADDPARAQGRYACLAVTAEIAPQTTTSGGSIGYPYRALVHFGSGRFALCKISGRPAEGSLGQALAVPVPRVCGG